MASLASNPISVSSAADRSYKPRHSYHNNQWHQERFGPDPTKMQVPTTPGGDHLLHDRGEGEAGMGGGAGDEQEYMGGGSRSRSTSSRFRSTARQVMAAQQFGDGVGGDAGAGARATEAVASAIVTGAARGSAALADEVGGDASLSLSVAPLKLEKPDEMGEIDGFLSDLVQPALIDTRCVTYY